MSSCLPFRFKHFYAGIIFLFISLATLRIQAQETWEKEGEGEIKDVEIEIIKERQIFLPRASRNFGKIPPRPYEPIKPAIFYEFRNFNFTTPDYSPVVRPLKLKQEELSKMYGNYLSGGLGNYASLFFEGSATTKRDKNKFLGAHLYSRTFGNGPVNGNASAGSTTQLQLFGKSMGNTLTLYGDGNFEYRGTYFYGYNPVLDIDREKTRQTYTIYNVNARIENTKASDFNYSLKGGYSYLQDHYQASEGELSFAFASDYKINEQSKFLLQADYFLITRKDSKIPSNPRHLLRIKPAYQFKPLETLLLTTGLNLALQNDPYAGSKDFHVYPYAKAQYELGPSFEVYGIMTGDMDKVNLHTVSDENLWVNSNISIYHTNRALDFQGGVSGKIGRHVAMNAGVSVSSLKNLYNYLNVQYDPSSGTSAFSNKFDLEYDRNTKRVNTFAEISFAHAETFRAFVRADYFTYETDSLQKAWHRPTYRMSLSSRYNLYEKISLEAGFIAQGGMKAVDPVTYYVITLDPAFDLNLKARYFLSKQISAFLQFNNMLSNNYPLYQSYPARGFQVLGGLSWSF